MHAEQAKAGSMPKRPRFPQAASEGFALLLAGHGFDPIPKCVGCNSINLKNSLDEESDESSSDSDDSSSEDENGIEELYFACAVDPVLCDFQQVELDICTNSVLIYASDWVADLHHHCKQMEMP